MQYIHSKCIIKLMKLFPLLKSISITILTLVFVLVAAALLIWVFYKDRVLKVIDDRFLNPKAILPVSGTGSMEPTFPKSKMQKPEDRALDIVQNIEGIVYPNGFEFNNKRYYQSDIQRGDIVSIQNEKVKEILSHDLAGNVDTGYLLKRIIGMPNETFELRGGKVFINDKIITEPYTKQANSTFGGDSIKECEKIILPENTYIVMGDNRKESNDSRYDLGLIKKDSIKFFIPEELQKVQNLFKNYRDTSHDNDVNNVIKVNAIQFVNLLNQNREKNNLKKIKINDNLMLSAQKRLSNIYASNGIDKTRYTMEQSMQDSGYLPIIRGEIPVQGYYTAEELLSYLESFPKSREFILNHEFTEIGIASFEGQINKCPTGYTIIQFGGFRPPNYEKNVVESYRKLLSSLKEAEASYKKARSFGKFYEQNKNLVEEVLDLFEERITTLKPIVNKIENNIWLTSSEQNYLENEDKKLQSELDQKIKELNQKIEQWNKS